MNPERVEVDTARVGDRDLDRLAVLLAWEASDVDCPEAVRLVLFSLAGQCREVLEWRTIMLGAMEQDLGQ